MNLYTDLRPIAIDHASHQRWAEAEPMLHQLIAANPDDADCLLHMGNCFYSRGQWGAAIQFYARAVQCNPGHLTGMLNMAACLFQAKHRDAAEKNYQVLEKLLLETKRTKAHNELLAQLYGNWSALYINNGTPEKAIELADKCLAVAPEDTYGSNHKSLGLLELGRWEEARPYWQRRFNLEQMKRRDFGKIPRWDGRFTPLLAVHGEQGLGDEILFLSALPKMVIQRERVIIECAVRLKELMQRTFPLARIYTDHAGMMAAEKPTAWIPMGDLFLDSYVRPLDHPGQPYLAADPALVRHYKKRLENLGHGKKVLIAWRGGTDKTHGDFRKAPLEQWGPVLKTPGCQFISIQYTPEAALEADECGVTHWARAAQDIDHMAALMTAADLVITVCQTAVHLAGALGRPCWVLTPRRVAWRYLHSTSTTLPMYNSVTLYRQERDDWKSVIENIARDLKQYASSDRREAAE